MRDIGRRIEKLEEKAGVVKGVSLETLVAASRDNPEAMRKLSQAGPEDPLIKLVLATGKQKDQDH